MAAPSSDRCDPAALSNAVAVGSARRLALYTDGSDTLYFPYPCRQLMASTDMTLRLILDDGNTIDWPVYEKVKEEVYAIGIKSTGSTFNSGTLKVYF